MMKHTKEHAPYSFRDEKVWGQSVLHTYEGHMLLNERSIREEIAKEKWGPTTGSEAEGSEGGIISK